MADITERLMQALLENGADLAGVGSLEELTLEARRGMPAGVSVAVKYPKETIRGIIDMPTRDYFDHYNRLNQKLDSLVTLGTQMLTDAGYSAIAQTLAYVKRSETAYGSLLPHKTVATRAGIGWIGKCALLVTKEYGSMVRISSILTDAPLTVASPVNASQCGACTACADTCPAGAVTGEQWSAGVKRESLFDAARCRETARERTMANIGVTATLCGKCIVMCPYTQKYLIG